MVQTCAKLKKTITQYQFTNCLRTRCIYLDKNLYKMNTIIDKILNVLELLNDTILL